MPPIFIPGNSSRNIIHHNIDSHGPIWITEDRRYRYLSFSPQGDSIQTSMDLLYPKRITFGYQKMILAGLMTLQSNPKTICIIGLGGGALTTAIASLFPQCAIETIELNPNMLSYAKDFFHFKETPLMTFHIQDGTKFFATPQKNMLFDAIVVDAFDENYIPKDFLRLQFVKSLDNHLTEQGIALVNTFVNAPSYDLETNLYKQVFKKIFTLNALSGQAGNRVIFASKMQSIAFDRAIKNAQYLTMRLIEIGLTPAQIQHILNVQ